EGFVYEDRQQEGQVNSFYGNDLFLLVLYFCQIMGNRIRGG
ncbi:unnamed protein product, partial [marine sediment metagenome]